MTLLTLQVAGAAAWIRTLIAAKPTGTLHWNVPNGDWVVLRAGMMPTGTKNSPSPPEATGLEVDKMNREALKAHFDAYVGHLLNRIPAAERTAWKHVVADSYEMGPQNWTEGFPESPSLVVENELPTPADPRLYFAHDDTTVVSIETP